MEKKSQFNVYLPAPLVAQVKHRAIDDQLSLSDWVERAIKASLSLSSPEEPMQNQPSLSFSPIVHVQEMSKAIAFYEALGGQFGFGSRDGDWAQIRLGGTEIGLLAHPPAPGESDFEFCLNYEGSLDTLQEQLEAQGVVVLRGAADEAFGAQLQIQDPDGRKVKINQIEPDLIR